MWVYDILNNVWRYLTGSQYRNSLTDFIVPYPGGLHRATMVIDSKGYLYVFGGWGYGNSSGSNYLNALWRYDIMDDTWLYLTGSKVVNALGNYSVPYPGGMNAQMMVIDMYDNIYVFGGHGNTDTSKAGILCL